MKKTHRFESGATLLEALVAVLIFSIGILAVIGLQALAVRVTTDAKYRADASFIANETLGRIWGDPTNLSSFVVSDQSITGLPAGKRSVSVSGDRVEVTIRWQPPGDSVEHELVAVGYVNVNN